jgi:hypothetical protein
LSLPPAAFGDPVREEADEQIALAHALVRQGKRSEATEVLVPALEYLGTMRNVETPSVTIRGMYVEAMYVTALTQADDAAGRRARREALDQASNELSQVSTEVRQLSEARELAAWIDEAKASSS